tara:strand:+ start:232 stop:486 length:255 start_codon:yes stop_codon:yes gene_type:complete
MPKTKTQKLLDKWTKEKWRTASGKPSTQGSKATGEAYMPEAQVERLKSTPEGRKTLSAANKKKREATKQGKQHAKHGLHKGKNR